MTKRSLTGLIFAGTLAAEALLVVFTVAGQQPPAGGQERARPTFSLSDPVPQDPAVHGAIDLHAHQDPDSNGPSYGQAARSDDALDLYERAKAAGMRGFVIKEHLDQSAGYAYFVRKLHPDMEVFGGMGSNLTTGPKVNPWAIIHMTEIKGGWGRIVWMPSWDSENSVHRIPRRQPPGYVAVAHCGQLPFWTYYPKPCPSGGELLPEVKEAIQIIATKKTRDSNGDLILATGHNSPPEVKLLVQEAVKAGVKHTIITHPTQDIVGMTDDEVKEVVHLGPEIYAEFTSQFGNPGAKPEMVKEYVSQIRAAGVDHAFISTDTGQVGTYYQPDALVNAAKTLRANGFTEAELDQLFKINPAKILGLSPPEGTR